MGYRLGIDATFIKPGLVGGAEFMTKNIMDGLLKLINEEDQLFIFSSNPWDIKLNGKNINIKWINSKFKNRFVQSFINTALYKNKIDSFLFPNYFTPPIHKQKCCKFVTVIHDLQYLHFPHYFPIRKRLWLRCCHEITLRRADAVIAISEYVKQDMLNHYGSRWENKIKVIHDSVSWSRFKKKHSENDSLPAKKWLECPYILSVAAQYPHKNLETLIRSFKYIKSKNQLPGFKLILVGQLNSNLIGTRKIKDLNLLVEELTLEKDVFITGFVEESLLGRLYENASIFVFPSLFEGFGMPPIEALGFGVPVVTTRLTSIPEVTMGQAVYVKDPLNCEEMAFWIKKVIENREYFIPKPEFIKKIKEMYAPIKIAGNYYDILTDELEIC